MFLPWCGSLISLPYYYLQPEVLWQPIGWAAVFMAINGYHVWRLWRERRPVELSADEARLYDLTFFPLTRRRFVDLARLGRWADLEAGDVLARPGQPIEEVVVPLTDGVEARIGERVLGWFAAGEIVGAAAVYGRPQLFEVVARESCRVLRVPVVAIKQHAEQDDQLARTLERIAREDLARKLERLVGQATTLLPHARLREPTALADAVICSEASANLALGLQPGTIGPQRIVRGGCWCTAGLEATPRGGRRAQPGRRGEGGNGGAGSLQEYFQHRAGRQFVRVAGDAQLHGLTRRQGRLQHAAGDGDLHDASAPVHAKR